MEDSDLAEVEQARAGDQDAFGVLVQRHSRAVFRLAFRMTGNEQDAEDVVQETFLRAYRQIGRFDSRAKFVTWLHSIAANCALDLLRSRRRRREMAEAADEDAASVLDLVAGSDPSPERLAISKQVRQRLSAAMGELSPVERIAFAMRHFDGIGIEEIAQTLGRPNGATRHSVFRAVQKLRRALEPVAAAGRFTV